METLTLDELIQKIEDANCNNYGVCISVIYEAMRFIYYPEMTELEETDEDLVITDSFGIEIKLTKRYITDVIYRMHEHIEEITIKMENDNLFTFVLTF